MEKWWRKGKRKNNEKERKKNKKGKERKGKKKSKTNLPRCGYPVLTWKTHLLTPPPLHNNKKQQLTNPNYSHFPSVTNLDFLFYAWKTHTNTGTCTEASRHQFSCPTVDLTITVDNTGFKSIKSDLCSVVWSKGWPHTATPGQATNSLNDRPSAWLRSW